MLMTLYLYYTANPKYFMVADKTFSETLRVKYKIRLKLNNGKFH